jgi:hypothetical protein
MVVRYGQQVINDRESTIGPIIDVRGFVLSDCLPPLDAATKAGIGRRVGIPFGTTLTQIIDTAKIHQRLES